MVSDGGGIGLDRRPRGGVQPQAAEIQGEILDPVRVVLLVVEPGVERGPPSVEVVPVRAGVEQHVLGDHLAHVIHGNGRIAAAVGVGGMGYLLFVLIPSLGVLTPGSAKRSLSPSWHGSMGKLERHRPVAHLGPLQRSPLLLGRTVGHGVEAVDSKNRFVLYSLPHGPRTHHPLTVP